ncbi:malate synthase [Cytobacillus eiseniae]|uniref:Malate synthase G n=1 Tax=Cytobacillus eiseniae TaxID=762947 RepID=A0ABS4R9L3_9BACI|nr:malate synthase G [Cytobacillus eiseniae]MBP2239571.1 malate synthase [Cytobacillus eiseniae]
MVKYQQVGNLLVAEELHAFINNEALPKTHLEQEDFWRGFDELIHVLSPINKQLLIERDQLQKKINTWHKENQKFDKVKYTAFLTDIGYLENEGESFEIGTENVDDEIAILAGPQLVVPVNNERYALNAANARWGSLYDALYGTNVISEEDGASRGSGYNPIRGEKVIAFARAFLDQKIPLKIGSHKKVVKYRIAEGKLLATLNDGKVSELLNNDKLIGFQGNHENPTAILFKNNGLHFEIQLDRNHMIGKMDGAGIKDILLEAALTTIMDCEDSVAAVDAEDKVQVYRSWLGLMKGDLTVTFKKGNKLVNRQLNPNRSYTAPNEQQFEISGRSLMLIRNVGHLMTNHAILDKDGLEVYEGIIDAVVTSLIAKHSLLGNGRYQNSAKGSIYIVKPKMHGSKEVAFANRLFDHVEDLLRLKRNTLKIGVMDEERRTSLNLKACIREVKDRIAFINTGFLDRTGDEMHTSMEAGLMVRKNEMKSSTWLQAYEKSNVNQGLMAGFKGRAQIGKGMWAMPDLMAEMVKQKIDHLKAGANTAWVPSPTAATLHALHYHDVDVKSIQNDLIKKISCLRNEMLEIPVIDEPKWSREEVQNELNNNVQGILGYVVRWVEQGIGCSKVPDINHIGLMEDRATLRISSQHIANWLHHGICTKEQVLETLKRMAVIVDEQNAEDANYRPMASNYEDSIAVQAACELIFTGYDQPSGYTEPILHRSRLKVKEKLASK